MMPSKRSVTAVAKKKVHHRTPPTLLDDGRDDIETAVTNNTIRRLRQRQNYSTVKKDDLLYRLLSKCNFWMFLAITSIGIYGFYSSSYKESFANMTAVGNRVALIEEKRNLIIADTELMKEQIDSKRERIKDQSSIRGQQETRMDSL